MTTYRIGTCIVLGIFSSLSLPARAAGPLDRFTQAEMSTGLKDALTQGASNAVAKLGRENGFFDNPKVKIPLPRALKKAEGMLRTLGLKRQADELVLTMNRAAEAAVPEAKNLFIAAVKSMTMEDAIGILKGGQDSATRYFRKATEEPLRAKFMPIVKRATEKVGVAEKYNQLAGRAAKLGLVKESEAKLETYITEQALQGLFITMADEERAIRQNPVKATTNLARKIFTGAKP